METEKNIPTLPLPSETASEDRTGIASETAEITWDDIAPEKEEDIAISAPSPSDGEAASEEKHEVGKTDAQEHPQQENEPAGNPFRFIAKAGMILLGVFAAVIFTVFVISGTSELLGTGIIRLSLGEIFGGAANITVMPIPSDKDSLPPSDSTLSAPPPKEGTEENKTDFPVEESRSETSSPPAETTPLLSGTVSIVSADLSAKGQHGLTLINETPYQPILTPESERDIPALSELYAEYGSDAPVVLIIHTHATESFAEDGASFTSEEEYRSLEPTDNMLAVGKALCKVLEGRGINTIHCEELFDRADFTMAYYNASIKIRKILQESPSVSYILDLHRDSIAYENGEETVRPVTVIDGLPCAQMMFVVGTDHGGSGHTGWGDNLNLACRLQSRIHRAHSGLMRSINLRSASFNQQYTKGSLLIEMGAVGSSVEEACRSAEILGSFLADEIIGIPEGSEAPPLQTTGTQGKNDSSAVIMQTSDDLPLQGSEA